MRRLSLCGGFCDRGEEEIAENLAPRVEAHVEPEPEVDEKQLVLSFQSGESAAYDTIYRLYAPRIQRLCRRMLVKREDADEATQEAFLRVYLALPRFNGRYQLGGWITRIATNVCLDRIRASSRRPVYSTALIELENDLVDDADSDPEIQTLRNAESRRVTRVLLKLPATHRAAIVLRDIEGMSYAEVAQTLGLSEVQTKALIHRARQSFKRSWTTVAPALLPARLFHRLRDGADSLRNQIADVMAPATQAATHCSLIVQQCGNYLVDKAASFGAAAVVGGAALGGAVAVAGPAVLPSASPTPAATTARSVVSDAELPAPGAAPAHEHKSSPTQVVEPPPAEPSAPPSEAPTAAPSASPPPTEEPAESPSSPPEETASPKPSPSATPAPAAPLPLTDVRFDGGQASAPKQATAGRSTADCATRKVTQSLDVPVSTSQGEYQGKLSLTMNGSSGFELDVTHGSYTVRYVGGGPMDRVEELPDGRLRLLSSGMFGTGSNYAGALGLPASGRFSVDLTLDCASGSVITETLVFQR